MSTQGQGDVVERLRAAAREIRNDGTASQVGLSEQECEDIADEITRLRTLLSSSRGEQGLRNALQYVVADAISAERARVIEECAKVAETEAATARSRGAIDISQEYTAPLRVAAALRALAQQDTRGADHG